MTRICTDSHIQIHLTIPGMTYLALLMANKVVVSMYNSLIYGIQYKRGPAYSHYWNYIPKRRWIRARGNVSLPPSHLLLAPIGMIHFFMLSFSVVKVLDSAISIQRGSIGSSIAELSPSLLWPHSPIS